jgi:hypothetical protein
LKPHLLIAGQPTLNAKLASSRREGDGGNQCLTCSVDGGSEGYH